MRHAHVAIAVADTSRPGVEHVPARSIGGDTWRLLRSPLYAMGVASGDTIRILDRATGEFEVVSRGGNVCVQLYLGAPDADDADATTGLAAAIASDIETVGGLVDGQTPGLIAFTIPVAVGFPVIEEICALAVGRSPGAEWQYSNVYDPATGEPIGWWK